jgi:ATP-dependent exoDNAse (exonuclease V) beta subunit
VEKDREPAERSWRVIGGEEYPRAPGLVVGTLVHEALAAWRFPGDGFQDWIEALARSSGLMGEAQIEDALARVRELLTRFQAHELFSVMNSAERRMTEVPYDYINHAGYAEHGIIDVLYQKEGRWTVVDYKTDEIEPGVDLLTYVAENNYGHQLNRYVDAVAKLRSSKPGQRPRAFLCFLDYQGGVRLHPKPNRL